MSGSRQRRYRYVAIGLLSTSLLFIGPAIAWAEGDITIDFVRHGQSTDNAANIIDTQPPGTPLTATGEGQAITVGEALYNNGDNNIDAVYSSELLRTQQTAWPLVELLRGQSDYTSIPDGPPPLLDSSQILPGLDEIDAGIYEGQPIYSLDGLLYLVTPIAWVFGAPLMPMPGSPDTNGFVFDERFTDAVNTIYDQTPNGGSPTDVAFSSAGAITTWALMNVKNPDYSLILLELLEKGQFLPNTGEVVVQGNPEDGWTLVSFDGVPVPQTPDLGTALFVDVRNLLEAPQLAGYNIYEALLTGDPTTFSTALQTGFNDVTTALTQFPVAVYDDFVAALSGSVPSAASDATALLPGDLSAMLGDAFGSL